MATPPRSLGKTVFAIIVIACAGAFVWYQYSEPSPVKEDVRSFLHATEDLVEKKLDMSPGDKQHEDRKESSAQEFSAALDMSPHNADSGMDTAPQADELVSRVDKALAEDIPAAPDGDSVSGALSNESPSEETIRDDSVVTGDFIQDLAVWMASSYSPSQRRNHSGYSSISLERANGRYSSSPSLRSVEKDTLRGRVSILNYVYKPGMLEALYLLYAPRFIDALEDAARRPRRNNTLENWQVADMFTVYGEQFSRLASSLDAAAEVDLSALVAPIHAAGDNERTANENFATAHADHATALAAGHKGEAEVQSKRMLEQARLSGIYAGERAQARRHLAAALRRHGSDPALSDNDLVFLSEWIVRHNGSKEATSIAASVCERMAGLCRERARLILAPDSRDAEDPAPTPATSESIPNSTNVSGMPISHDLQTPAVPETQSMQSPDASEPASSEESEKRSSQEPAMNTEPSNPSIEESATGIQTAPASATQETPATGPNPDDDIAETSSSKTREEENSAAAQ